MAKVTYDATGSRKSSVARVRLVPGEGKIVINGRELSEYFSLKTLELVVRQPLETTETLGKYDVTANVVGGGIAGQAGAVRHGIARALLKVCLLYTSHDDKIIVLVHIKLDIAMDHIMEANRSFERHLDADRIGFAIFDTLLGLFWRNVAAGPSIVEGLFQGTLLFTLLR